MTIINVVIKGDSVNVDCEAKGDNESELHELKRRVARLEQKVREYFMSVNDVLAQIDADLKEASTEIPAKLAEVQQQLVDNGADPALVQEISGLAKGLADIVPNAVSTGSGDTGSTDTPPADTGSTDTGTDTPPADGTGTDVPPVDTGETSTGTSGSDDTASF